MSLLKSQRHHWWPRCVSRHWAANDGTTGWLRPDGSEKRIRPDQLGVIGNGHHIKLGRTAEQSTVWDASFEKEFDLADNRFPAIITWLERLERRAIAGQDLRSRFLPQEASDNELRTLTECVVSLAVRGPMNRQASVALAEQLRGPLQGHERNALIGVNMQRAQKLIAESIGFRAKFAVLYSTGREFIYGDGFFHNVKAVVGPPFAPKILAPITPLMSVMVSRPMQFAVEPRLVTMVLSADEVDRCNHAVQVYSRDALFYRNDKPTFDEEFKCGEHRKYASPENPIDTLFDALHGTGTRETSPNLFLPNRSS
jgi:hypothetical protein